MTHEKLKMCQMTCKISLKVVWYSNAIPSKEIMLKYKKFSFFIFKGERNQASKNHVNLLLVTYFCTELTIL